METPRPKRPYRKPAVERISLAGEETAAIPNCKTVGRGGGIGMSPGQSCKIRGFPACHDSRGS